MVLEFVVKLPEFLFTVLSNIVVTAPNVVFRAAIPIQVKIMSSQKCMLTENSPVEIVDTSSASASIAVGSSKFQYFGMVLENATFTQVLIM